MINIVRKETLSKTDASIEAILSNEEMKKMITELVRQASDMGVCCTHLNMSVTQIWKEEMDKRTEERDEFKLTAEEKLECDKVDKLFEDYMAEFVMSYNEDRKRIAEKYDNKYTPVDVIYKRTLNRLISFCKATLYVVMNDRPRTMAEVNQVSIDYFDGEPGHRLDTDAMYLITNTLTRVFVFPELKDGCVNGEPLLYRYHGRYSFSNRKSMRIFSALLVDIINHVYS